MICRHELNHDFTVAHLVFKFTATRYIGHNFFILRNRAFIFGMCVPYDVCSLRQELSDGIIFF